MSEQREKKIVLKARTYQLRLVEYLEKRNGIVYLPTGSGKTYVAILALKRFSANFDKSIEDGGQRALFMCNTVELARQQAFALKQHTNLKIGFYVGERGVDNWNRNLWEEEINTHQVLVGTAQVILDLFVQKYMKLENISIVVIDECHHATGQHPYHEFMRLFQTSEKLPRVVALTGVLIKGNDVTNLGKKLKDLETTFRGNIITVSDKDEIENVMLHSTKPREYTIRYPVHSNQSDFYGIISSRIDEFYILLDRMNIGKQPVRKSKGLQSCVEPSKKKFIKAALNDFKFQLNEFGIYTASIAIMAVTIELEIKKRQSETMALRHMYRSAIALSENIHHLLAKTMRGFFDDNEQNDVEEIIMNFSTPKIQKFVIYLKQTFSGKQPKDISCLVFVERRMSAKCIYGMLLNYIQAKPELREVIVPQFMVGQQSSLTPNFEVMLERKWQKSAIQHFRDGECNLIVCSSVLEEGIDVQACNYVLVLDPVKTFNMYVQSKGRARSKDSVYLLFCAETDNVKVATQLQQYRLAHMEIANYLNQRVLERADPQEYEIQEHFKDLITPYVNKFGSTLLASSALILLHRYCQKLPSDAFGIVLPWFNHLMPEERTNLNSQRNSKEIVSLTLPLTSKLRSTIYSDPMPCVKSAKISAAFKTIVKLYEMGEINERFLPTTADEHVAAIADKYFEHWKKYGDNVMNSQKEKKEERFSYYPIRCPEKLYEAMPRVGEPCYAYAISIEPEFESNDYSAYMYDNLRKAGGYALLLRKRLPHLAQMPLYCSQGKLKVQISEKPQELKITNAQELDQLQRFHIMIFRDLLKIWKPFYVLDRRNEHHSYLIVPLAADGSGIDMQLVADFQRLPLPCATKLAQRKRQEPPRLEDFEGKVVTQWYANFDYKRMLVTKVHTDLTPNSNMMDNQRENTYYDFTMGKYGSEIEGIAHKQQFLIEVQEITDRRNFYVNQKLKSSAQSKARLRAVLIPELCFSFGFPGHLWLKLIFLPSILRRLTYMLHAECLRERINKYLGLADLPINGKEYRPQPLFIDHSLKRNVDHLGNAVCLESYEEPKSLLEPLSTKTTESLNENLEIADLMEQPWQDYMEPMDIARKLMIAYPVDLSYYYAFTSGMITSMEKLEQADKEMWSQTQFKMLKGRIYGQPKAKNLPALKPSDEGNSIICELSVLQRTISNQHITAAEQGEFLAALTTAGSVDVFDMERLELLGDSFLKLSATLYLASRHSDWNEGILTQVKSKLVSNRNLLYCLRETDIPQRICDNLFSPNFSWLPPSTSLPHNVHRVWIEHPELAPFIGPHNLSDLVLTEEEVTVSGHCSPESYRNFLESCESNKQSYHADSDFSTQTDFLVHQTRLYNKILADTLEAILGVVVKNYGLQHGFRMLEFFGICKPDIGKPLTQLLDLQLGSANMRTNVTASEVDAFLMNHAHLEQNLGYKFRDRAYLLQALTHPSFPTNRITGCYQELEFIGDAILDFLISAYIFEHKTRMTPGELTDLRSALVNNTTLACICVRHRLHFFILAENALLAETIKTFAEFQETQGHRVTNQVRILMEEKDTKVDPADSEDEDELGAAASQPTVGAFNVCDNVEVPKALGDVLEALIAAVYLDSRDLNTTWQVIYKMFEPELIEFSRNVPYNPLRQLNCHKLAKPIYSAPSVENGKVMVTCHFTCIDKTVKVHGFGNNSKQAKLAAAKHALKILAKHES